MILVLGSTSDGLEVCNFLKEQSYAFILSAVSQYNDTFTWQHASHIMEIPSNEEEMMHFFEKHNITLVIDAAHPYTVDVSDRTISLCEKMHISYIRYETEGKEEEKVVHLVDTIQAACELASDIGERIFLSVGGKNIQEYVEKLNNRHVLVKVLPNSDVIQHCEELGLFGDQIIAFNLPFTKNLYKELLKAIDADAVILRGSSKHDALEEKVEICKELQMPCIVIQKPMAPYPEIATTIMELADYLNQIA